MLPPRVAEGFVRVGVEAEGVPLVVLRDPALGIAVPDTPAPPTPDLRFALPAVPGARTPDLLSCTVPGEKVEGTPDLGTARRV